MLFDTHLHLIYLNQLSYPWLENVAALKQNSTYEEYELVARRIGISGALHMEVDVAEKDQIAETDMVCELMTHPASLLQGAIASCRPESSEFAQYLEAQQQRPQVKGLRRVLHIVPDELSQSAVFRNNVKRLSGTGITFDLCVFPHQIPLAIELVDHCPDVVFILDLCGVPDVKAKALSPWSTSLSDLSKRQNVIAKISGVVAYGNPQTWTLDDVRPFVEHTIKAFGWDRVIWGSDSPVCTLGGHLETWVATTHALLEHCSMDEKTALLHSNAKRLWKLK